MKSKNKKIPLRPIAVFIAFIMVATALPVLAFGADVEINDTNFLDGDFRSYVTNTFDKDGDGFLSDREIAEAKEMDLSSYIGKPLSITDLKGIERFTSLESLTCSMIPISSLDLSQNTKLKSLVCRATDITTLDLSKNTKLTSVRCTSNSQLESIDLSTADDLSVLDVSYNPKLASLNLSGNSLLQKLECSNCSLTSIDMGSKQNLTYLNCSSNALSRLDFSSSPNLETLFCSDNNFSSIDLSANKKLKDAALGNNLLTGIDVKDLTQLESLDLGGNKFESFVLESESLKDFRCENSSELTSLDVSGAPNLESLYCANSNIQSLDISGCPYLIMAFENKDDIFDYGETRQYMYSASSAHYTMHVDNTLTEDKIITAPPATKTLERISFTLGKTDYILDETINPDDIEVMAYYTGETAGTVVQGWDYEPKTALTENDAAVTVTYTENGVTKTAAQTIKVTTEIRKVSISISPRPKRGGSTEGSTFTIDEGAAAFNITTGEVRWSGTASAGLPSTFEGGKQYVTYIDLGKKDTHSFPSQSGVMELYVNGERITDAFGNGTTSGYLLGRTGLWEGMLRISYIVDIPAAQTYPLSVGGYWLDDETCEDIPWVTGEGAKASYDPVNKILTMENVTGFDGYITSLPHVNYPNGYHSAIIFGGDELTIKIKDSTIGYEVTGLGSMNAPCIGLLIRENDASVTIEGDNAVFNGYRGGGGIDVGGDNITLTLKDLNGTIDGGIRTRGENAKTVIEHCDLEADIIISANGKASDFTFTNSNVNAGYISCDSGSVVITDSHVSASPQVRDIPIRCKDMIVNGDSYVIASTREYSRPGIRCRNFTLNDGFVYCASGYRTFYNMDENDTVSFIINGGALIAQTNSNQYSAIEQIHKSEVGSWFTIADTHEVKIPEEHYADIQSGEYRIYRFMESDRQTCAKCVIIAPKDDEVCQLTYDANGGNTANSIYWILPSYAIAGKPMKLPYNTWNGMPMDDPYNQYHVFSQINSTSGTGFEEWLIEGKGYKEGAEYAFTKDTVIYASYTEEFSPYYDVSVARGTANPRRAKKGYLVEIKPTPTAGKKFAYWILQSCADDDFRALFESLSSRQPETLSFYMPGANVSFGAHFEDIMYQISFDSNNGVWNNWSIAIAKYGEPFTIPECTFTPPNAEMKFKAWEMDGKEYNENEKVTFTDDNLYKTLKALWEYKTYNINVTGGTANPNPAKKGETVTITAADRSGYTFKSWNVVSGTIDGLNSASKQTTFKMPGEDVAIKAEYTASSSGNGGGGGGSASVKYNIIISAAENGQITANKKSAAKGETVSITFAPAEGYETGSLTLTDKYGNKINASQNGNVFTFAMPSSEVTAAGSFNEKAFENPHIPSEEPQRNKFIDVNDGRWSENDIYYVFEKGLMFGVSDFEFDPEGNTTRGMIVAILYRLEDSPSAEGENPFDDVKSGSYYENAVIWAQINEIVYGYGNGKFGPDDKITREQLAAIMFRYSEFKGIDVSARGNIEEFKDADRVSSYAVPAIEWMTAEKLIFGDDNNMLNPRGNASREQVAAVLHRFCENILISP